MGPGYATAEALSQTLTNQRLGLDSNTLYDYATMTTGDQYLLTGANVDDTTIKRVQNLISNSITGIEGIPYQFSGIVDRRLTSTSSGYGDASDPAIGVGVGRKYAEKVFSRFPFLFITPCTAEFMKGFSASDKKTVTQMLITGAVENANELIEGEGKYYSVDFAYADYYQYLNCMLNVLAVYLGLGDTEVKIGGKLTKLGKADWSKESNSDFKTFFSAAENLIFYVDGFNQVSKNFSNDTGDSSLASTINGFSDQVNELKFLFGGSNDGLVNAVATMGSDITSSLASNLSSLVGNLGGGIVESLSSNGVNTILNGGKIIFPEIWTGSNMDDGSASFEFKFRSPDHDNLSIYLNVLKPYCKLLCLVMPHESKNLDDKYDPHSYTSPFLVKSSLKGKYSCDMGIISGMSVTQGAECQWNDDGLPTQIDVSIDIKNLYKSLAISSYNQDTLSIVNNTAYMDFLANMAGLNILQMEMGRKFKYYYYITAAKFSQIPSRTLLRGSQAISRLLGELYDLTS